MRGVKIVLPDGRAIVLKEAIPHKNYFQYTHCFIGPTYGHTCRRYISIWDSAAWPSVTRRLSYVLVTNMPPEKKWATYTKTKKKSTVALKTGWPDPKPGVKLIRSLAVSLASLNWPVWYRFYMSRKHSSLVRKMNFICGIVGNAIAPCMAKYVMRHVPRCHTLVDLFCGGGGFSLGAARACRRLKRAIGVDIDPLVQRSYAKNMSTFPKRSIDAKMLVRKAPTNIDGVLRILGEKDSANLRGYHIHQSPPCQSFVMHGRNAAINLVPHLQIMHRAAQMGATCSMEENKAAASRVLEWRSKQNKEIRDMFHVYIMNAHDYGAPANRVRCIVTTFPLKTNK